ncbi:MAG: magnesium transporter [Rhodospirillales bacterium]
MSEQQIDNKNATPPGSQPESPPDPPPGEADATPEVPEDLIPRIVEALDEGRNDDVWAMVEPLHYSEIADMLEWMSSGEREELVGALGSKLDYDSLTELDETVREEVIGYLGIENMVQAVAELDSDDAVELFRDLDAEDQRELLEAVAPEDRAYIEEALSFPEDSAGRLMQRELVWVPDGWNVGQTIDYCRASADEDDETAELPETFYDIYVVDAAHKPVGHVPLSLLLRTKRQVSMKDLMNTDMHVMDALTDQEDVAHAFRQRDLVSAPVTDAAGRLVGVITIDDVVDVIDEEHEEDMMLLGGVSEGDLYDATLDTTRSRFTWLLVNLGTAVLASLVIGLFEATLEQIVALAVLMPIVASMGGNAGTQTLTVAVRGLATKELSSTNAMRVMLKEVLVGVINGVLFAVIAGVVAWVWFDSLAIGGVIAVAMVVNLVVAALAGTSIPILLERWGIDPAIASSVFLTTVTDIVGFFAFLGLAAVVLM